MSATASAAPFCVAAIDLDVPITDLECARDTSPPYAGAWILVCRSGRPLGSIQVPLEGTVIPAAELEHEVRRQIVEIAPAPPSDAREVTTPVSVVVASSCSRPTQLERCIESLRRMDYPDYELIVVDNRAVSDPALDLEGVRVLHEPRPGGSAARNRGLAAASTEIIAFTDDDVDVDPNWLRAIAGRFARQPDVAAVTGLVVPSELETQAQVLFEQSGSGPDRVFSELTFERAGRFRIRRRGSGASDDGSVVSLYATGELGIGSNMAFRASALRSLGGFDEALGPGTPARAGEELAVFLELLAAGQRIAYEPTAIVHHTHRATVPELQHQIYSYGMGFTAMLTAITLRNPRHLLGLASVFPVWLRSLRNPESAKRANRASDYPRALVRAELKGMLVGPAAYLRSRRWQARWRNA
jgi:cellulose synthase/poly-beta-1,6-N-acetylglucosamine synthase-like glycosyltransferase